MINKFYSLFIIALALFAVSCGGYKVHTPSKGISYKFYSDRTDEIRKIPNYNFNRLQNGYGLVIFGYYLEGFKTSQKEKKLWDVKKGLRIWEYKFETDDPDTVTTMHNVKIFSADIGDEPLPLVWEVILPTDRYTLDYDIVVGVKTTFVKNKIVYGGRIAASDDKNVIGVFSMFERDCDEFYQTYKKDLNNIETDTILIKITEPEPEKPIIKKGYYDN